MFCALSLLSRSTTSRYCVPSVSRGHLSLSATRFFEANNNNNSQPSYFAAEPTQSEIDEYVKVQLGHIEHVPSRHSFPKLPFPATEDEYEQLQARLTHRQRSPRGSESFLALRTNTNIVFRDFTPYFEAAQCLPMYEGASVAFLRGRRWGKSTFGAGWLAYVENNKELFKGTAVEHGMRPDSYIGIKLDVSFSKSLGAIVEEMIVAARRALKAKGINHPLLPHFNSDSTIGMSGQIALEWTTKIISSLEDISIDTGLRFALLVDEYDSLVIKALKNQTSLSYNEVNYFFAEFYTSLKAKTHVFPFLFITGSSRLAIKGFWSGPNNITDLTYNSQMATALGYTWEQIEMHFPIQLAWLSKIHQLTPSELKTQLNLWYNNHRWSYKARDKVFNPWSIHQFMREGIFSNFWGSTGSNTRMLTSQLLMKGLIRSLAKEEAMTIEFGSLTDSRLPSSEGNREEIEALSDEGQKSLLVGAGILAIHPDFQSPLTLLSETEINLCIPNRESKSAILSVLQTATHIPKSFSRKRVDELVQNGKILELIDEMITTETLKNFLNSISSEGEAKEVLISLAFSLALCYRQSLAEYRPSKDVRVEFPKRGQVPFADHVIYIPHLKQCHIIEFKQIKESEPNEWRLPNTVYEALTQVAKYQPLVNQDSKEDAMIDYVGMYSVVVFSLDGTQVEVATAPCTYEQLPILQQKIFPFTTDAKRRKKKSSSKVEKEPKQFSTLYDQNYPAKFSVINVQKP